MLLLFDYMHKIHLFKCTCEAFTIFCLFQRQNTSRDSNPKSRSSKRSMKHRQREFELSLKEGLVDFSNCNNVGVESVKNGRNGGGGGVGVKNVVDVAQTRDLFDEPPEEFDDAFAEELKVE